MVRQGNHGRATPLFEESLAIFEEVGDTCASAYSMSGLGMIAGAQGDYKRATGLLEKSLAIARTTNDRSAVATTLFKLGQVVFQQGDLARAAALWQDSTVRRMDLGDNEGIALCLAGLARTALRLDQPERAARLLGATEVLRETIGAPLPPSQREDYEHDVASSRAALGENLFQAAWAEGRAMTLQQAVGCALTPLDASATIKGIKEHDASKRANILTHREREVATLIAQGRTNRVISAALAIAERTVDAHVEHILNKLGFTSRTQIAAWAVAQGLHQNPAD